MGLMDRIKYAWNAFMGRDPTPTSDVGIGYSRRPDRSRLTRSGERTTATSIYNRIAMDAAKIEIKHVRKDEEGRYIDTINSTLNECLNVEANLDQTGRAFRQDVVLSMLDEGVVAIVPVEMYENPFTGQFKIASLRVGKVLAWYPAHVRVRLYNEWTGKHEDRVLPKRLVALPENPLYPVMNEPNSTLQRLLRKFQLLDMVDEQTSSGKLNIIIGLPYVVKTESRRKQAEHRRAEIEAQLTQSKYGIAYTDGTEHITQLNRALENNLLSQIEYLQKMLYGQLGMTEEIFNGSAGEEAMLNYYDRTIEPILSAITDEMNRKFLTKTARTQRQALMFFRDPFRLIPLKTLADVSASLKQAEIISSNEGRQALGFRPDKNKESDALRNPNINPEKDKNKNAENGEETEDDPDKPGNLLKNQSPAELEGTGS